MRIFFIGYMGSGKSAIAKLLARRIGYEYIDTDQLIENQTGKTINHIFEAYGEDKFREIESAILKNIVKNEHCVVATGGGLPCFYENMKTIKNLGISMYLEAQVDVLAKRIFSEIDKRPLLNNINSFDELKEFIKIELTNRNQYYAQADYIVDADNEEQTIVNTILDTIKSIPPEQNPKAGMD